MAHEFNNVLMGILPFVEVIRRGKNVTSSLEHITRAVERGKRVSADILRFTQPAQPVRDPFEVSPWISAIVLEARSLLPNSCSIDLSIENHLWVDGDASQLQQILTNLLRNARDAMAGSGGGTLTITVRREAPEARLEMGPIDHAERFAHFIVSDTGCGMTPETLRHIFEPLFTTKKKAIGLGLALAHQVVQQHGGEIFVESHAGQGTAVHVFLPLAEEGRVSVSPAPQQLSGAGPRRVLLVEDDVNVATGLAALLEVEGLNVELASDGAEAIRAVEVAEPDVVVLDVGLPDMEGTAVYHAITATRPRLPIIFSTGHADCARIDSTLGVRNVVCLQKPYDSATLLKAIREAAQN
jgi:two-component system cell cycle sensor histidine kinase/response regulator CckA